MSTQLAWITWISLTTALLGAKADDRGARAVDVVVDRLDVVVAPDDDAFVSSRLDRGEAVEVVREIADGWLAIKSPVGTFCWVDDDAVRLLPDGRVVVTAVQTTLRFAREGASRPGPAKTVANRGATFGSVKQPVLTYGAGDARKVWRAVKVDGDDVRFVRAAGVSNPGVVRAIARPSPPRDREPERRASHEVGDAPAVPPDLAAPLASIDEARRSIAARPVEQWEFAGVRKKYQALLAGRTDDAGKSAIQSRLDEAAREDELAEAARDFLGRLKKSRQRDGEVDRIKRSITEMRAAEDQSYDAEGLLQVTATRIDGEKVFLLLNEEGRVVTYLRIPPGVDVAGLMSRHVGVRGRSRFNDMLKFRLLDVRDIDALDAGR